MTLGCTRKSDGISVPASSEVMHKGDGTIGEWGRLRTLRTGKSVIQGAEVE